MFKKTANDLGLDQVLNSVSLFSLSQEGAESIKSARPIFDSDTYTIRQKQVSDTIMALINCETEQFRAENFPDIRDVFEYIEKNPTAPLEGEMIYNVAQYIESAEKLKKVFSKCSETGPIDENDIRLIIEDIDSELSYAKHEIFKVLESPGKVKESYPTVKALIDRADSRRIERTREAAKMMNTNSALMQESNAVLRDGRIVLPVKTELHSKLEGYIQGTSQTGSTLFMEPFHLVDLNNAVNMALHEIELEIARLIAMLSDLVRNAVLKLRILSGQVARADFLYAFASYSRRNNCVKTLVSDDYVCNLIKARHPLLKENCVPIDLAIANTYKAVVLTGPNAGGKTVTMKTVGLFALLNQICGYIPASDGSALALFDRVFTDIGDDQSIENQLSTFSGHMKSISFILRSVSKDSLVILDELGSGTDPQEGAAIARSVLEYCIDRTKLTLTTSHHGVLKQFAYANDNVLNASMEFDEKTLEPTFRVISGLPGESHAIDTAIRMHLPKSVTNSARKYMGKEAVKISSIIKGLEIKRQEAQQKEDEINKRLEEAKKLSRQLEEKEKELLRFENKLKREGLSDFDDFIRDSRKELEGLVKELREGEITREKTKKVKEHILALEKERGAKEEEIAMREKELDQQDFEELARSAENIELKVGMDVLCGPYRREGTVVKVEKNGRFVVAIGPMKFTFKETELLVPRKPDVNIKNFSFEKGSKIPSPKLDLDLRGYRLEEAIDAIEDEIEACCMHGMTHFSIIHGYGEGRLSTGIHQYLKMNKIVTDYHFAHPDDGGQGKTYVTLK